MRPKPGAISNRHFPDERHDFGGSKIDAVLDSYDDASNPTFAKMALEGGC